MVKLGSSADLVGILAQQPGADAMEGAGPGQRIGHDVGTLPHDPACDAFDPARHLGGGPARERHQQNPSGIGAVDDQVGNPVRQRVGLARSGTRDHEKRYPGRAVILPHAVLDGSPLLRIERLEIGGGLGHAQIVQLEEKDDHKFPFCSQQLATTRSSPGMPIAPSGWRAGGASGIWPTELVAIEDRQKSTLKPVESLGPEGEPIEPVEALQNAGEFPLTDQGEAAIPSRNPDPRSRRSE